MFPSSVAKASESILESAIRLRKREKLKEFYPDYGPLARDKYPKNMEFFRAGKEFRTRCVLSANRTGKTEALGGYETVLHLTGRYPIWWEGHRFTKPISAWAAGDTSKTVKDIIQRKLLGPPGQFGTGLIPAECIERTPSKPGLTDAVDSIWVKHASGGVSVLTLKSYDQKRESFQGTEQDLCWLDEESPEDVLTECVLRTMKTSMFGGGLLILTFTPLMGWTEVVDQFLNDERREASHRYVLTLTWEDCAHLSAAEKESLFKEIPEYQRKARTQGIPELGSGLIYKIPETELVVKPFAIPDYWARGYGMDVGDKTAAIFGAHNRDADVLYIVDEYYREGAEPSVHAAAIKARGEWVPGFIDPASLQTSQTDRQKLFQMYVRMGLKLQIADNAVEAGIMEVQERMATGRLKIFSTCQGLLEEHRKYRRDDKGRVVKLGDHRCLHGDTIVHTDQGRFRIADLVGKTGRLISRSGAWQRFDSVRLTGVDQPVVRLEFSNGDDIVCTPDHRFLTPNGWKKAIDLAGFDCYDDVSQHNHNRVWWSTLFPRLSKSFRDFATTAVASISAAATGITAVSYTSMFGKLSTEPMCQPDMMSITKMRTERIISLKTLKRNSSSNISQIICVHGRLANFLKPLVMRLRNGMPQKLEDNGTGSIMPTLLTSFMPQLNANVTNAARTTLASTTDDQDSVQVTVSIKHVWRPVSIMSNAFAWFAALLLSSISTFAKGPVRQNVLLECVSVKPWGTANVFCLRVPVSKAFCVGPGVIAHNCDSERYLISKIGSMVTRGTKRPAETRDPRPYAGDSGWIGDRGWMA